MRFLLEEHAERSGQTCIGAVIESLHDIEVISKYDTDQISSIENFSDQTISHFPLGRILFVARVGVIAKLLMVLLRKQNTLLDT